MPLRHRGVLGLCGDSGNMYSRGGKTMPGGKNGIKTKNPGPKPRKITEYPLTNGEGYVKIVFHTVGVCRLGHPSQHGQFTTDYGGCQETSL